MINRTAMRRAAIAAAVTGLAASVLASSPAQAAQPESADDKALIEAARTYFAGENAITVEGGATAANATRKAQDLDVAATFRAVRDDRMEAREQLHGINELAGVRYSAVDTELTPVGRARTQGDTARLSVREHTQYTFAGSKDEPYSYTVRHNLSFARADGGGWVLSKIATLDGPANLSTPEKLDPAELSAARKAAKELRTGAAKGEKITDPAKKASSGTGVRVAAAYDYSAMVDFATKYAKPVPEDNVPYERDTNDCTNFISHALKAGGWERVLGWYRSDSAWWYRGNPWPLPKHSWTWGGAPNWQRFARDESKRVYELSGPSSLAIADVVQFEIFGYSPPGQPGHTMMVTDFTSDWMPKMSYHSTDTLNRPLSEIIAEHSTGEKFWYFRT
ncbi:amidase domain-containing protein [Streptomyces sp. ISL-96]|uniref:amidase domain-containing protein n=1 Tax=Streptomyces sp. ISL-96 TaxID=2819191 RepID=UPI001BEBC5A3|nr:amidase domain-containing protein [Streptomyces sp. ISL-96]MBT2493000.1 amidase domain-containing protein [Streptomyces sp. ISL-96]